MYSFSPGNLSEMQQELKLQFLVKFLLKRDSCQEMKEIIVGDEDSIDDDSQEPVQRKDVGVKLTFGDLMYPGMPGDDVLKTTIAPCMLGERIPEKGRVLEVILRPSMWEETGQFFQAVLDRIPADALINETIPILEFIWRKCEKEEGVSRWVYNSLCFDVVLW